ncbi:hypothetical protein EAF04_009426 [Stromatinia cepivora]|nr:hypothetical protein EAF04_009426 [Stromatinia cepivora]
MAEKPDHRRSTTEPINRRTIRAAHRGQSSQMTIEERQHVNVPRSTKETKSFGLPPLLVNDVGMKYFGFSAMLKSSGLKNRNDNSCADPAVILPTSMGELEVARMPKSTMKRQFGYRLEIIRFAQDSMTRLGFIHLSSMTKVVDR